MFQSENVFSLLIVDDEPLFRGLLQTTFIKDGYILHTAANGEEALSLLEKTNVDAALVDLQMPKMDGLSLLTVVKEKYPEIMVIMLTGKGGINEAVQAIKLGAVDFLKKPFPGAELRVRVDQLYRIWLLQEENKNLKEEINFKFGFERLVGNSTAISKVKETIVQIGKSDVSVLIQGETGTGKELVARAIHFHSPRAESAFVPVDCASISENVIESELFGHIKGAFTGAYTNAPGLIRSSEGGTLFFDEIGELSPAVQAKLLRTIQEREVRPVGSTKSYPVNIRVLAATNRDLEKEVGEGRFREDLFYRLNVVTVQVPPLRKRKEDIALLTRYFIRHFKTDFSSIEGISDETLEIVYQYDWPGNVRELQNVIMRALAMGKGKELLPVDLPPSIHNKTGVLQDVLQSSAVNGYSLASYEQAAIHNALQKCSGNRQEAANLLGIGVATLYRKLKLYNED
jgi:DNA-binding NtrC family response regulator